jgi:hypothetical protein
MIVRCVLVSFASRNSIIFVIMAGNKQKWVTNIVYTLLALTTLLMIQQHDETTMKKEIVKSIFSHHCCYLWKWQNESILLVFFHDIICERLANERYYHSE